VRVLGQGGATARQTRVALAALVASVLLCCAAVATVGNNNKAIVMPDEVDGLELNAYLTPNDVEEFKKVSTIQVVRRFFGSSATLDSDRQTTECACIGALLTHNTDAERIFQRLHRAGIHGMTIETVATRAVKSAHNVLYLQ